MTQPKSPEPVRQRPLGTTGLMVSELSLGCVKFGRTDGLKHPGEFSLPDDRTIVALLECAREHGINLLDTAPAYGTSEERLGALLPGNRQDWLLSSKAGEIFTQGKSRFDFHPDAIQRSLEQSLRRLRTDYLDLFLLHSDGNDTSLMAQADLVARLQELKTRGLIRSHGISAKSHAGLLSADGVLDVVMLEPGHILSSDNRGTGEGNGDTHLGRKDAGDTHKKEGYWEGYWGHPSGKTGIPGTPKNKDRGILGTPINKNSTDTQILSGNTGLLFKKILASGHETPAQHRQLLKQRFRDCLATPGAASIVVGTLSVAHLKENIALTGLPDLHKESGSL